MKKFLIFIFSINFLMAQEPPPGSYYFVSAKLFDSIPQFYGDDTITLYTENLNYLALLLGDNPKSLLKTGQTLVDSTYFYYEKGKKSGFYQPFAYKTCPSCEQKNLPIGPKLKEYLNNYFGNSTTLDLTLPFYTDSTRLGENGGAWIRRKDKGGYHGAVDFMQTGHNLFDVCAAADGFVKVKDEGTIILHHNKNGKDFLTFYTHLDFNSMSHLNVNDTVKRGQRLGNLRVYTNNEHLHFMVFIKGPSGRIGGVDIEPRYYAIDPFGIYDYRRNRFNLTSYNYLPDISSKEGAYLYENIQGAVNKVHWRTNPLINSYPEMFDNVENWTNSPFFGSKGTYFADVNGDLKADVIAVNSNAKIIVKSSSGNAFLNSEEWTEIPFFGDIGTYFADVTGDGKADAIAVNRNLRVTVRRSNGARFTANEEWTNIPYFGDKGNYYVDVTGDGKADAIVVNSNGPVVVRRSSGNGFTANENWTSNPFFGDKGTFFADVTGDGLADAIAVNQNLKVTVRRNTGSGFAANEEWTEAPYFGTQGTYIVDLDGDDKADLIKVDILTGKMMVRFSNGNRFLPEVKGVLKNLSADNGLFFADLQGNHKASAIMVKNLNVQVRKFRLAFK
jgi:hypothetical protein